MARINPQLFARLQEKLGVSKQQVYARIQNIANDKILDRSQAALVLAAENSINIQRFSSTDERASIRGALGRSTPPAAIVPATTTANPHSFRREPKRNQKAPSKTKDNSVFVVHGRDDGLRKSMFDFLRALSLRPMEWNKAVLLTKKGGANPHVDDIIDEAMDKVQAVVVIFSPDDLASLRPCLQSKGEQRTEGKLQGQPRPNVIFEAGLALGRHPEKTLLVQVGSVRGFSDIAGKHLVRLSNDMGKRVDVANRLGKIGCKIDQTGTDWITAGNFEPKPDLPAKRKPAR
jgi:predicted nucleotide-binding protein